MGMPMGKPPMYKTVDEIEKKIEKYFEYCKGYPLTDSKANKCLINSGLPFL